MLVYGTYGSLIILTLDPFFSSLAHNVQLSHMCTKHENE